MESQNVEVFNLQAIACELFLGRPLSWELMARMLMIHDILAECLVQEHPDTRLSTSFIHPAQ